VRYYQATALVQELQRAREELQLERTFARLDRYAVIILDDIGYVKKSEAETHVLFGVYPGFPTVKGENLTDLICIENFL